MGNGQFRFAEHGAENNQNNIGNVHNPPPFVEDNFLAPLMEIGAGVLNPPQIPVQLGPVHQPLVQQHVQQNPGPAQPQAVAGGPAANEPAEAVPEADKDTIDFARTMIDILECTICLELVVRPRICTRGHLCCRRCLRAGKFMRCPLCKTKFQERVPYVVLYSAELLRKGKYEQMVAAADE